MWTSDFDRLTPRAKAVVENALKAAAEKEKEFCDIGDLLRAMLVEPNGLAVNALSICGLFFVRVSEIVPNSQKSAKSLKDNLEGS